MPGINRGVWGAEAGRDGRTLTLKEALPAGLCLRSALGFTPRKSSRDFPPLPTGGCPGGGSRPRSAASPRSLRAAPRTPAGLPRAASPPPSPTDKKPPKTQNPAAAKVAAGAQVAVLRRGGTGPILPFAGGLRARGGRPQPGRGVFRRQRPGSPAAPGAALPAGAGSSPAKFPARRLQASGGSACLALYFFKRQPRQCLPALPGCQAAGAAEQIQLCAPTAPLLLGTRDGAQAGGLQAPGREPL